MSQEFDIHNDVLLGRFFENERRKNLILMRSRYSLPEDVADDVYQDSCIALFKNIQDGKLVDLTSTLSSYFTSICINQSLKRLRDDRKDVDSIDDENNYSASKISELLDDDEDPLTEEAIQTMHDIVAQLPPPCEKILWGFYRDGMTMEQIAKLVDYKNAQTAKAKKSQCLSRLITTYKERLKAAIYGK